MPRPELSLVIPVFNEEADLPAVETRLKELLTRLGVAAEVVFVDDGSRDRTMDTLLRFSARDARFRAICLSRRFGRERAIAAGLDRTRGKAVIVTDLELQPPEVFSETIDKWKAGYDIVFGKRKRSSEPFGAGVISSLFGALMPIEVPLDAGDFRLLSRRAVAALRSLRETHQSARGLIAWAGFRQTTVEFERLAAEKTIGTGELLSRALDGIAAFSTRPLRIATWIGALLAVCSIVFAIVAFAAGLGIGAAVVPLLFSVQFILIGILGEYVGRIYEQVKRRPLYVVAQRVGFGSGKRPMQLATHDFEAIPSSQLPRTPSTPPAFPNTPMTPAVGPTTTRQGSTTSEVPPPPAAIVAAGAAAEHAISKPKQPVASPAPPPADRPSVTPAPPPASGSVKPPPLKLSSSLGAVQAAPPAPVVPERASTPPVAPRRPSYAAMPHPAATPAAPAVGAASTDVAAPKTTARSLPPPLPSTEPTPSQIPGPSKTARSLPPPLPAWATTPSAPPAATPRTPSVSAVPAATPRTPSASHVPAAPRLPSASHVPAAPRVPSVSNTPAAPRASVGRIPAAPRPEAAPTTARSPSTAPIPADDEKKG